MQTVQTWQTMQTMQRQQTMQRKKRIQQQRPPALLEQKRRRLLKRPRLCRQPQMQMLAPLPAAQHGPLARRPTPPRRLACGTRASGSRRPWPASHTQQLHPPKQRWRRQLRPAPAAWARAGRQTRRPAAAAAARKAALPTLSRGLAGPAGCLQASHPPRRCRDRRPHQSGPLRGAAYSLSGQSRRCLAQARQQA